MLGAQVHGHILKGYFESIDSSSVDAGILGYNMYLRGQQFYAGDGIVTKGVEATIQNIGRLGKDGMKETNEEIIKMMISD